MVIFLVAACGSAPAARATPTPSSLVNSVPGFGHLPAATSARLNSPLPIACTGNAGGTDPIAIVTIHGQDGLFLRDYADSANPVNICSIGAGVSVSEILDPHHLVITYGPRSAVVEVPSGRVFELGIPGELVAVAPDLSQVLWLSITDPPELHDSWDRGDVLIQRYMTIGGRCGDADIDSRLGAFSRSAKYGYSIWNAVPNMAYLNVVGHRAGVFSVKPPTGGWGQSGGPGMGLWSPIADTLYYAQQSNIWTWTHAAGAKQFKAGIDWIDPAMSADGKHIVYAVRLADGRSTVHLMDPVTGADQGQLGSGFRKRPFFLTTNLIWLKGDEQGCIGGDQTPYIYDLRDHTETSSRLDMVWATWPSTSALGG